VRLSPLGTAATTGPLYQPQMVDDDDCGAVGEMKIVRRNRSTRRKPAPEPLCPPQIPHDLTRVRIQAAAVGSQRLTAWAMARPTKQINTISVVGRIVGDTWSEWIKWRNTSARTAGVGDGIPTLDVHLAYCSDRRTIHTGLETAMKLGRTGRDVVRARGGDHMISPGHVWRLLCQYPVCGAFSVAHLAGAVDITMGNFFRFVFPHVIPFILDNNNVLLCATSIPFYSLTDTCNTSEYEQNRS
jgi:hypothetical protein